MNRFFVTVFAAFAVAVASFAQPSAVKNAAKSTFRLVCYDANGNRSAETYGVFTSANGEAVAPWSALSMAARAEVVDFNGKTYNVRTLVGVNELYDMCRFRVDASKTQPAAMATATVPDNSKVWLVNFADKKVKADEYSVERSEKFMDKYAYYIFAYNDKSGVAGSPFVNANGQVIGLLQQSETNIETHAVDPRFATTLAFNSLDVARPDYNKTAIRMQLPDDSKQALLMIMLTSERQDSAKYVGYIADYIAKFPQQVDGYTTSALRKSSNGDFAGADADMKQALKHAANKAEAHAEYSRVMYQKLVYSNDSLYKEWTLDKALGEAEEAYKIDPQLAYRHSAAQILFSKREYAKAYDIFDQLSKTSFANSEVFYEAAQCKAQLGAKNEELIVLLDSAVARCTKPYTSVAAPYVLARGQMYDAMKDYRRALADYNEYDTIMYGRANADFYFTRYKCEVNIRQYQVALNDIAHAAYVCEPQMRPIYLAEMASLQLRVNMLDNAVKTADLCLQLDADNTDALIIKGVALVGLKKKPEAMECLQRAKTLGDQRADEYIKKYK